MKKIIVLSLILLITICSVIDVYATSSFQMSLIASKNEVNKGDEFVVDVKISNIQMDKGIIALGGRIEYDRDSLELQKMEGQNGWARPSYNDNNGKFATDRDDYGTVDEVMFKITFKVKQQSKENLTITLNEVAGSNGKDEVKLNNIITNITVKNGISNPDGPKPDNPNLNTNTNTDNNNTTNNTNSNSTVNDDKNNTTKNNTTNISNNSVNNSNKNNNNTNVKNNNIVNTNSSDAKSGIFPKTGTGKIAFGLIGLLIISAIIFYIRIRIIDSKSKKNNIIK